MDEQTQKRIRQVLFDAMELLDNEPEKFEGIVLLFAKKIDCERAGKTTLTAGGPSFVTEAKRTWTQSLNISEA